MEGFLQKIMKNKMELMKKWVLANKMIVALGTVTIISAVCIAGVVAWNSAHRAEEPVKMQPKKKISQEKYYKEEEKLDDSEENVLYEEPKNTAKTPSGFPYLIRVNRLCNVVTVYAQDEAGNYTVPVRAMTCSVGLNGGTPTGVFKTSTKYAWRALYGNVYGQYAYRIKGPILFHSVPYLVNGDKGSLEYDEYNKLGEAASMGCVRLAVCDAKWLMDSCPAGTTVEIYDDPNPGPLGKPNPYRINVSSPCRGWDPTDPDGANPWRTTAPNIQGCGNFTVERGETVDLNGVSAIDYKGVAIGVAVEGTVDTSLCGKYTVTYTAVDDLGNTAVATSTYQVVDTTKPVLTQLCPVTINREVADVRGAIIQCLQAVDGADVLDGSMITLDTGLLDSEIKKGSEGTSGTISCTAYVTDLAGNASEVITVVVNYEAPIPDVLQPSTGETPMGEILP